VYVTHIAARDPFIVLTAYAGATDRIRLGTGVTPIYARTPVATAQAAATIDEYSGGRMVLGLGVSHRPVVEGWYGQQIDKPVGEMREYLSAVRAMFEGEDPPPGKKWPTGFHFMGYEPRRDLPIYVAGLSPAMLRLAGELADGVILWLCEPGYIRDVVVPEVTKGREKAGKALDGFDIVAAVPSAVTDDPDEARNTLRGDLIPYFSLPFYRAMIARAGFESDIEAFDAKMKDGDAQGAAAEISDRYLETLGAIGTAEQANASIDRYFEAGATSPGIGPIPRTDFETTLRALTR
jgi:alkanesulfonate monooxygenase SsuD/methylene tetrahydromethanopterin reductase-like flavin-dependent oxidoreductase (luciferase family)